MSKSGSRYGRRSNWFKIHCLLQEQTNGNQHMGGPGASPFGPGFLPGFLPTSQSQTQQTLIYSKDSKDRTSPSQEDLALQSHLIHVAMLKQEQERGNKSPHPDDVALQNQLRFLAWQKERERISQQPGTPPGDNTPPSSFGYQHPASSSPIYPANFVQKESVVPASPPEVFRPFLPTYKRTSDTPSDSAGSSVDEHDESRSNSAQSFFKTSASPTLSEREFTPRKINATVTLTTGYNPHHGIGLIYPPPGLITPAASQHSPRGRDLLIVSPSPGGLAIEQNEPIDLSVRSSKNSPGPSQSAEEKDSKEESCCREIKEETLTKSKPLDLTLGVKRPAELPLSIWRTLIYLNGLVPKNCWKTSKVWIRLNEKENNTPRVACLTNMCSICK